MSKRVHLLRVEGEDLIMGLHRFVEHFSPYCTHCKHFAPTWEKLVEHYESMESPGVHLAQVDCAANGGALWCPCLTSGN